MGDANRRMRNDVVRSLLISIAENSEINDSPNTAIPGVSWSSSNRLTGMLL